MAAPTNGTNGAHPVAAAAAAAAGPAMTEDEIALYDRQIRLWGMGAQEKIRSAHVLLITMRALGNEIAKNLVLAGIGALTIADHNAVTQEDLGAQFLLATPEAGDVLGPDATAAERAAADKAAADAVVGRNRAVVASEQLRAMNPRVRVIAEPEKLGILSAKNADYFKQFTLVIATDLNPAELVIINTATRFARCPFYTASSYGFYGFIFADLIEHDFVIERTRGNVVLAKGTQETPTRSIVDVRVTAGEGGSGSGSGGAEKEIVTKRELYSTWFLASDASPLPAAIRNSPRRLRNVSPFLPCLRALWEFQERHAVDGYRTPDMQNPADLGEFVTLVNEKQQALGTPPVPSDKINAFTQGIAMREIAPVVSVIGGELAQDVINTLGHTQQPIQNLAVFDGFTLQSAVYALHPPGETLGHAQLESASLNVAAGIAGGAASLFTSGAAPGIAAGTAAGTAPAQAPSEV